MNLLSLPEELLTLIVEHLTLVAEEGKITQELRKLRHVCKRFAFNHGLQSQLFQRFVLLCDLRQFRVLDALHISNLAPFIQHITFVGPLRYASLDYENFKNMLRDAAKSKRGCFRDDMNPVMPSDDEWLTGYAKYMLAAKANYALLFRSVEEYHLAAEALYPQFALQRSLEAKWTEVLRQLPNCHSFRIALVDYSELNKSLDVAYPDCITQPVRNDANRLGWEEGPAAAIAEAFAPTVISVLEDPNVEMHHLTFSQASVHYEHSWCDALPMKDLNVSNLKSLTLEPYNTDDINNWDPYEPGERAEKDAVELFLRCRETLESFDCLRGAISWGVLEPVALPRLKVLLLYGSTISSHLTRWIESCPSLEMVELHGMELKFEPATSWREVFDGLRNHPKLTKIHVEAHADPNWIRCTVNKSIGLARGTLQTMYTPITDPEDFHGMARYICGLVEWDDSLSALLTDEEMSDELDFD